MNQYRKLIAALMAAATVTASVVSDGHLSPADVVAILGAFLGALGVYGATNEAAVPLEPAVPIKKTAARKKAAEAGMAATELCLIIICAVLVLWAFGVVPRHL